MVARKGPIAELLNQPLVVALVVGFTATAGGYATGQATMEVRVARMEAQIKSLETYASCATSHIVRLENGAAGPLPCVLEAK